MTRLVLGSASPGRLKVLRQAGVDPLVVVSGIDEDAVLSGHAGAPSGEMVGALAAAKAEAVTTLLPVGVGTDCVVIGCDSMLHIHGQLRGKPASAAEARSQWQSMAGQSGQLHTGHCGIVLQDNTIRYQETQSMATTVRFGEPTPGDLDAYLTSGEPLRVAGGFTLDGLGGWFIDGVDGDPSSVIGISLPLTRSLLAGAGLSIAALWSANPAGSP
jgi:septum formation protein